MGRMRLLRCVWGEVFPSGISNCLPKGWQAWAAIITLVVAALLGMVMSCLPADADEGSESLSVPVAQMVTIDLKNARGVGLTLDFSLGEEVDPEICGVDESLGQTFKIMEWPSGYGYFAIDRHGDRPYLRRLEAPKGYYVLKLEEARDSIQIREACQHLLYADKGASAIESAKRFAAEVFKKKTGEFAPGGGGTMTWETIQEYPVESWRIASGPVILSNRVRVVLQSNDDLVKIELSLIVVARDKGHRLEVCEVDVDRRPASLPYPSNESENRGHPQMQAGGLF